jgi:hypothetical protein
LTTDTINLTSFTQRFLQTGPQSSAGDFDSDGDVDGRDFLMWQRGESPNPFSASDLAGWQENYGTVPLIAVHAPIPEPHTVSLTLCATITAIGFRSSEHVMIGRSLG